MTPVYPLPKLLELTPYVGPVEGFQQTPIEVNLHMLLITSLK